MGLQAVNETTQAHGCWTASIKHATTNPSQQRCKNRRGVTQTWDLPSTNHVFSCRISLNPFMLWKASCFFCSISIIPVWNVRKGGQGISHKKWREEGRLNERIKEGGRGGTKRGQAAVTKQAEKGNGAQTRLDCLSWSAALLWGSREVKGQSLMMLCSSAEFYRTVNFTVD